MPRLNPSFRRSRGPIGRRLLTADEINKWETAEKKDEDEQDFKITSNRALEIERTSYVLCVLCVRCGWSGCQETYANDGLGKDNLGAVYGMVLYG